MEDGERTDFVSNGWDVYTELGDGEKVTNRLVRGFGIVAAERESLNGTEPSGMAYFYYHGDEHNDVSYITRENGSVKNQYEYDVFGSQTRADEMIRNRYGYNGEQYDGVTEQYYLRARFYNPAVARFTQEDVYRGDGLNLYAYCGNNGVGYEDPSGYGKGDNKIVITIPDNTKFKNNFDILGKSYTRTDVQGTVYAKGGIRTIDRKVYQMNNIDWDYVSTSVFNTKNLSNRELAKQGKVPFGSDDMWIELHHLTQTEPGSMIEIMGSKHDSYSKQLHGIIEDGLSFRNNPELKAQYEKFRSEYWKQRIDDVETKKNPNGKCKK